MENCSDILDSFEGYSELSFDIVGVVIIVEGVVKQQEYFVVELCFLEIFLDIICYMEEEFGSLGDLKRMGDCQVGLLQSC